MTEINENTEKLPPSAEQFILHWGEMGNKWGVNRSVSQIHALLYLCEKPLTADGIAERLNMARSNVSNSLKELQNWSLIRRVQIMGDRRDYFEAETDLWEMLMRIVEGRKAREIDPTLDVLKNCVAEAKNDTRVSATVMTRLVTMLRFVETLDRWYSQVSKIHRSKLAALIKMGSGITRMTGAKITSGKTGAKPPLH